MKNSLQKFLFSSLFILATNVSAEKYIISFPKSLAPTSSSTHIASAHVSRSDLISEASRQLGISSSHIQDVESFSSKKPFTFTVIDALPSELKEILKDLPEGSHVENDSVVTASFIPNDTYYGYQWAAPRMRAPEAWDITRGASSTVIAVVDTGVDRNHPDLSSNVWHNPKESFGNNQDLDGDGFNDDVVGWNFVNSTNDTTDDNHHGTHVAGIIAAMTDNGRGVAGIAHQAKILPIKVLGADGTGTMSTVASGILYALKQKQLGIDVAAINLSLGSPSDSQVMRQVIGLARDLGVTVVVAAGNEGHNLDQTPSYPANLANQFDNVISVGAIDSDGTPASFSNYGDSVTIAAPGVGILSTVPYNPTTQVAYAYLDGTSMATPYVAGVIGLMHAANPSLNARSLKKALIAGAASNSNLDGYVRNGIELDALGAVQAAQGSVNTYSLHGTVQSSNGGLSGALVSSPQLGTVYTNDLGYYSFDNVPEGTFITVSPSVAGYVFTPGTRQGTINSDSTADFSGNLALYTLNVKLILNKKSAIKNASISVASLATGKTMKGKTNAKGILSLKSVPAGDCLVTVTSKSPKINYKTRVTLQGNGTLSISFKSKK